MRRAGAAINPHPNWHPGHDNRALALDLLCARITAATPKQTAEIFPITAQDTIAIQMF